MNAIIPAKILFYEKKHDEIVNSLLKISVFYPLLSGLTSNVTSNIHSV